jgi:hypothetical protein
VVELESMVTVLRSVGTVLRSMVTALRLVVMVVQPREEEVTRRGARQGSDSGWDGTTARSGGGVLGAREEHRLRDDRER